MTKIIYVDESGSYGGAENLVIIETSKWSETDFDILRDWTDWGRRYYAKNHNGCPPSQFNWPVRKSDGRDWRPDHP